LWLDEHYSATRSITGASYSQILQGELAWEGNNAPFFYAAQKVLCDAGSYDPRYLLPAVPNFRTDPFSNTYLRLISLFLMALAPAALFYYFSRRYSWGWGSFAALLCLSSWLFWWYGLEARPYIHFLTLTILQAIIFLELARYREGDGKLWPWLGIVNALLALTITASILQTFFIGAWFVFFSRRLLNGPRIFFAFIIPAAIASYYYSAAVKGGFWFPVPFYKYYLANIPWNVLAVAVGFLVFAGLSLLLGRKERLSFIPWLGRDGIREAGPMAFFLLALSVTYLVLMAFLKMNELAPAQGGAPFANRYLINLVPVGIMAMTVFSHALFRSFKDERVKIYFIILLAAILAWRFVYAYLYVHAWIGI